MVPCSPCQWGEQGRQRSRVGCPPPQGPGRVPSVGLRPCWKSEDNFPSLPHSLALPEQLRGQADTEAATGYQALG